MNEDYEEAYGLELDHLKKDIAFQQETQWWGMALVLLLIVIGKAVPGASEFVRFAVPLNYFAVARSDYLIHRNAAKIRAIEDKLGFIGNETLQRRGGSYIAWFDIPLFAGIAILGQVLSPNPLLDMGPISVLYWALCATTAAMVWLATKLGGSHYDDYRSVL